mmetsp:Transcript_122477/g.357625  ORF Transcript_122477/g.357625 Transcript_122477/m.357625 type:complete len:262 (+) Transcript_122477:37-822(+)
MESSNFPFSASTASTRTRTLPPRTAFEASSGKPSLKRDLCTIPEAGLPPEGGVTATKAPQVVSASTCPSSQASGETPAKASTSGGSVLRLGGLVRSPERMVRNSLPSVTSSTLTCTLSPRLKALPSLGKPSRNSPTSSRPVFSAPTSTRQPTVRQRFTTAPSRVWPTCSSLNGIFADFAASPSAAAPAPGATSGVASAALAVRGRLGAGLAPSPVKPSAVPPSARRTAAAVRSRDRRARRVPRWRSMAAVGVVGGGLPFQS